MKEIKRDIYLNRLIRRRENCLTKTSHMKNGFRSLKTQ